MKQRWGKQGRVLIRASGTEPLLRVMVEAQDAALASRYAQSWQMLSKLGNRMQVPHPIACGMLAFIWQASTIGLAPKLCSSFEARTALVARAFLRVGICALRHGLFTTSARKHHMEHKKPAITLSSLDMDRLEALMEKLPANFPGFAALEAELDRADVLESQEMPANVVTMNSTVRFTLLESGKDQTLDFGLPQRS